MVMHRDLTSWSNLKSSTLEVPSGGWRGDCCTRRGTQTGNDATGAFSNLLPIKLPISDFWREKSCKLVPNKGEGYLLQSQFAK